MLCDECRLDLGLEIIHEILPPQSERFRIVTPDIVDALHDESSLGFDADVIDQLRYGRQVAAWENVMIYETETGSVPDVHAMRVIQTYSSLLAYASYRPSGIVIH